jgi:hypothetical protein
MVYDALGAHGSRTLSMAGFLRAMGQEGGGAGGVLPLRSGNPFAGVEPLPALPEAVNLLIEEALERSGGNQSLAARLIGISQPALSKRLKAGRK